MSDYSNQKREPSAQDYLDYEYYTCATDFWYWLKHFGWMRDEERSALVGPGITLWPTLPGSSGQREFLEMALAGEWIWVGKSRRLGISWLSANLECWDGLFHDNVSQAVIAQDDTWSIRHQARTRFIYDQQPAHLRRAVPLIGMDNKHELGLSNNSVFNAWPSTSGSVRGAGKKRVRLEEVAYWENAEEAWTAIQSAAAQVIGISTGSGEEGLYYNKWQSPGSMRLFFMPWQAKPGRDAEWYEQERAKAVSDAHHKQEHPAVPEDMFLAAGSKFWDALTIRGLRDAYECIPAETRHADTWRIYDYPEPGKLYVVGGDVADGGGDACVASVLDVETGYQVAKISSHVYEGDRLKDQRWSPSEFAEHLLELGRFYNWAFIGPENNSMGAATCATLVRELGYPEERVYHHEEWDKQGQQKVTRPGWRTTTTSRGVLLGDLRRDTELLDVVVQDGQTYRQMIAMGHYKGRWQHPPGQHDDEVFAVGIANQIRKWVKSQMASSGELTVYRGTERIAG